MLGLSIAVLRRVRWRGIHVRNCVSRRRGTIGVLRRRGTIGVLRRGAIGILRRHSVRILGGDGSRGSIRVVTSGGSSLLNSHGLLLDDGLLNNGSGGRGGRLNDRGTLDTKVERGQNDMESTSGRVQTSKGKDGLSGDSEGELVQVGEDNLAEEIVGSNEIVIEHREANTILFRRGNGDDEFLVPDGVQSLLDLGSLPNLSVPSVCDEATPKVRVGLQSQYSLPVHSARRGGGANNRRYRGSIRGRGDGMDRGGAEPRRVASSLRVTLTFSACVSAKSEMIEVKISRFRQKRC